MLHQRHADQQYDHQDEGHGGDDRQEQQVAQNSGYGSGDLRMLLFFEHEALLEAVEPVDDGDLDEAQGDAQQERRRQSYKCCEKGCDVLQIIKESQHQYDDSSRDDIRSGLFPVFIVEETHIQPPVSFDHSTHG